MQNKAPTIIIRNANLVYHDTPLFENLNLILEGGQITCLLGPSGVGKSSLLRLIAGLYDDETTNPAAQNQTTLIEASDHQPLTHRIAYMAQSDLLMPWLTVLQNVLIGPKLRGEFQKNKNYFEQRAMDLLTKVGLGNVVHQSPSNLSGGMRQRAALVRTLIEDRPIVLMDESFSALDVITRLYLQELATDLLKNRTVLLVTHDPLEALRIAHRIHVMSGKPVTLDTALIPPGDAPRDVSDPAILSLQAQLLQRLRTAHEVNA